MAKMIFLALSFALHQATTEEQQQKQDDRRQQQEQEKNKTHRSSGWPFTFTIVIVKVKENNESTSFLYVIALEFVLWVLTYFCGPFLFSLLQRLTAETSRIYRYGSVITTTPQSVLAVQKK